jgi:hypothetical protein
MPTDESPQPSLFSADGEPTLAPVRVCWSCNGNGVSTVRDGPCTVCHDGCGWLPDYDPDTEEMPY